METKENEILRVAAVRIKEGHHKQIIPALEKLVQKRPSNAKAWFYLGYCRFKAGDLENAGLAAQKSVQLGYEKATELVKKINKPTLKNRGQKLVASLPLAEMYTKAGLAIWMILGIMMAIIYDLRYGVGFVNTLVIFLVVVGIYAAYTCRLLFSCQKWIDENTTDHKERFVLNAVKAAAKRTNLPVPRIAIDRKYQDINAFTYGLGPKTARVVVTEAFMDKLNPSKEELVSVLLHELGHVKYYDFVVSTILRFPIWLINKIGVVLSWCRFLLSCFLKGFLASGACFGLIGLFVLFGILVTLFYMSVAAFMIGVTAFLCLCILNSFEREREYVADAYSACMSGGTRPLQKALGKLELASQKVTEEFEKRQNDKNFNINDVEVGHLDTAGYIKESLATAPSFTANLKGGEILQGHPATKNRIYYLENPVARKHLLSSLYRKTSSWLDRIINPESTKTEDTFLVPHIYIGAVLGILLSAVSLIDKPVLPEAIGLCLIAVGAVISGICSRKYNGEGFLKGVMFSSFASATSLLIIGPWMLSPWAFCFPVIFAVSVLVYSLLGIVVTKIVK